MSGSPIPDIRHSAAIIDILLKSNKSGDSIASNSKLMTTISPVHHLPVETRLLQSFNNVSVDPNSTDPFSTPIPNGLNSFYFYKVSFATIVLKIRFCFRR